MFEQGEEASKNQRFYCSSENPGFISDEKLTDLIQEIVRKTSVGKKVDYKMMRELLLELDLCYSLESSDGLKMYFMPIIFSGGQGTSMSGTGQQEDPDQFGYRVQCQDKQRTSLSPALFPRYQIYLRKQMEAEHKVLDDNFIFSLSRVEIRVKGCWIFVEIDDSTANHVDIVVRFFKEESRDWAMKFVQDHIVDSLIKFCASEKGCPGVQLVIGALRTECVVKLTPRDLRKEGQSMLLEDLKQKYKEHLEDQLKEGQSACDAIVHWPEIRSSSEEHSLPSAPESIENLLSSQERSAIERVVLNDYKELPRNSEEARAVSKRLESVHKECPGFSVDSSREPSPSTELASLVSQPPFQSRDDISMGNKLVLAGIKETQELLIEIFSHIKETLSDVKSSLKEVQLRVNQVSSAVDTIIRWKISEENHEYPNRPDFSRDSGWRQTVKAKGLVARPIELHFMCEARDGRMRHFVEDQPGWKLLEEKGGQYAKWARTLSVLSLRTMWLLLKRGAHVAAGLGNVIPTISSVTTGISVAVSEAVLGESLDLLKSEMDNNAPLVENDIREAWLGLRNHLASQLTKEKCADSFKLYQVRNKSIDDPYAWLCQPCMRSAQRRYLLE